MAQKELIVVIDDHTNTTLPLNDLSDICHISYEFLQQLMEFEIIHPIKMNNEWVIPVDDVNRIRTVLRLKRDLEMNLQSIAIIIDLLEERKNMQEQINLLKRHYLLK